jgi:pyocin large subunit-like protein
MKSNQDIKKYIVTIILIIALWLVYTFISSQITDSGYEPYSYEAATTALSVISDNADYEATISDTTASEATTTDNSSSEYSSSYTPLTFRNDKLLNSHYEKHGIEMGYNSASDYVAAANAVIYNPDSLHKLEAEDGDDVYFLESTNEFVVVSTDGYIRTYYYADIDYFNRQ